MVPSIFGVFKNDLNRDLINRRKLKMQMNLFDAEEIKDVRSEAQSTRKIAYDMGEKVGGARKDEAALRKEFEEAHSETTLKQLENHSAVTAAEMITKDELFKHFSLKEEKERGTEPVVARIKELLIQRVVKIPTSDTPKARKDFLRAANYILNELVSIYTLDELVELVYEIRHHMRYENLDPTYFEKRIGYAKHILNSKCEKEEEERAIKDLRHYREVLKNVNKASKTPLRVLGKSFTNFFLNHKSANGTINNVRRKVKSWDDLLALKKSHKKRKSNKPVWERILPERPDRIGGTISTIRTGEELMNEFGFRAVEFGNWTNDEIGANHIFRSSEAFYDLVDILGFKQNNIVSLHQRLAMAYGSRGRGRALGHYEPTRKIINLTRNRGSLGVLAHEWFHALDNYLYDISHSSEKGIPGYFSSLEGAGDQLSPRITDIFKLLMKSIKDGPSIIHIPNNNQPGDSWRISSLLKSLYQDSEDLEEIIIKLKLRKDEQLENRLSFLEGYQNKEKAEALKKKERNKNQRDYFKEIQALVWWHEQQTGERLDKIPVPTDKSQFYNNAIKLDRQNKGKYWSSNVELAARAFEAYIEDLLRKNERRNDYLVCGTNDPLAFPVGEEREKINNCFDILFVILRHQL